MDTPELGSPEPFALSSQRLGALPIVNHFLDRMGLPALLERYLPSDDPRLLLAPASAVRLVVANLLLGRSPLYALGEWALPFDPALLAMSSQDVAALNDDRAGRALLQPACPGAAPGGCEGQRSPCPRSVSLSRPRPVLNPAPCSHC